MFVTASIGIALSHNVNTVTDLLKQADLSLYQAKNKGKNQFCHFNSSMLNEFNLKSRLSKELRLAITNNELELYYQPIITIGSGNVEKAEVLIRWNHPEMGLLTPDKFISIAEETGQIIDIGYFVMEQAFKKANWWKDKHNTTIQLSLNKSPIEIYNSRRAFAQDCFFLLDKYNMPAEILNIEITENVLLETPEDVVDTMLRLKSAAIEISLDDFGTGYSSLAYLNRLDIDYLKIDKQFVDNITTNTEDKVLCKAMINIAHTLGLKVIAEGIEHESQYRILKELSCDYGQGYLFSRPVNADNFENLYINKNNVIRIGTQ